MFKQTIKEFFKSKTNWTSVTMIVAAIVGYFTNEFTASATITQIFGGLGLLFIRDAVAGINK